MDYKKQSHSVYYTRYHLVISTKYRRKVLKAGFGEYLKKRILGISEKNPEIEIIEENPDQDHVHMLLSIPPKYAVAQVVGFIKGKSAIHIAREFAGRKRNFVGQKFWARGYFVSTVGRDETVIREYIRSQEREDLRLEQLELH